MATKLFRKGRDLSTADLDEGHVVFYNQEIFTVQEVKGSEVIILSLNGVSEMIPIEPTQKISKLIEPVPLTTEWLHKCNCFPIENGIEMIKELPLGARPVIFTPNPAGGYHIKIKATETEEQVKQRFRFVHELQNWWKKITGEKLQFNPESGS